MAFLSSIPLVNFLLDAATRKRKADELNLPDSPTLKRVLTARGGLTPVSTTTPDPEAVTLNERPTQPLIPGLEERPRQVTAPTDLQKAQDQVSWVNGGDNHGLGGSTLEKHGRARSFLEGFLSSAGQGANRALQQGNVGWGGVAQALGGGVGGGAVYGVNPDLELEARHKQAQQQAQAQLDQTLQNQAKQATIEDAKARTEGRAAQIDARQRELDIRQQGQDSKDEYYTRSQDLRQQALDQKISFSEWKQKQAELDREFKQSQLEETTRHNRASESIGQTNAGANVTRANRPPASSNASTPPGEIERLQSEMDNLVAQDKQEPTYNPIIDRTTGKPATNDKGETLYSNTTTQQYKDRHRRIAVIQKQLDRLRAKPSNAPAQSGSFSPSAWQKANPSGNVNAAIDKAKRLGYVIVN